MTTDGITKVLLVEDSATVAAYVASILGSEPGIHLLPVARTAEDGVKSVLTTGPAVVLMDIKLPDHDGLWAIQEIMAERPCPIVVLSGYLSTRERNISFEALRAGAVEVLAKPAGISPAVRQAFRDNLVSTVRLMASAVVVRRKRAVQAGNARPAAAQALFANADLARLRYVLVGASTGGPEILYGTLSALPAPAPYPILITQHTLEGFDEGLAQWLSTTGHRVTVASDGEMPAEGRVILAPAGKHMRLGVAGITLMPGRRGEIVSSVDVMFESAARIWGAECLALLLSGMGKDGANGMRALFERGALTIGQAPETCVVASMPESARSRGAVHHMLKPDEIASVLRQISRLRTQASSEDHARGRE